MKNPFNTIKSEFKKLLTKEILLYFVFLQIAGIFFFAMVYMNRVGRAYPVVVADLENNAISRMVIDNIDSSPELKVSLVCHSMEQAMEEMKEQRASAVVFIPKDFYSGVLQKKMAHIKIFVDSRNLVAANSLFTGLKKTVGTLMAGSKLKMMQKYFPVPDRLIKILPVRITTRQLGNPGVDYFLFMLLMYLVMLIQQCVLVGSALGLARENENRTLYTSIDSAGGIFRYLACRLSAIMAIQGKILLLSALVFYAVLGISTQNLFWSLVYLTVFSFVVGAFSQFIALFFNKRIRVLQLLVFISVPAVMASGYTFPLENFPAALRLIAFLIPSTPMLNCFPRLTTLPGSVPLLWPYLGHLASLFVVYFLLSALVIRIRRSDRPLFRSKTVTRN